MNKMNKMTLKHAIEVFKNGSKLESRTDRIIERDAARQVALKSMIALDAIDEELHILMEGDRRTFCNRNTEDGMFYDGVYAAMKVFNKHMKKGSDKE